MAQGHKDVIVNHIHCCEFDPHLKECVNIFISLMPEHQDNSPALSSAPQHIEKFGEKWGTECLRHTRFPLPTLLFAGFIVNLVLPFASSMYRH